MKKKMVKKLELSRETVAKLDRTEMERVGGGIVSSDDLYCMMTKKTIGTGTSDYN